MTPEEAKELAIKKWQYIVNNNGDDRGLINAISDLAHLLNECAYCQLYLYFDRSCSGCPLNIIGQNCLKDDTFYRKWVDAWHRNDTENMKKHAIEVLELIKTT